MLAGWSHVAGFVRAVTARGYSRSLSSRGDGDGADSRGLIGHDSGHWLRSPSGNVARGGCESGSGQGQERKSGLHVGWLEWFASTTVTSNESLNRAVEDERGL